MPECLCKTYSKTDVNPIVSVLFSSGALLLLPGHPRLCVLDSLTLCAVLVQDRNCKGLSAAITAQAYSDLRACHMHSLACCQVGGSILTGHWSAAMHQHVGFSCCRVHPMTKPHVCGAAFE